ncbi:unnamed protein product [Arctia plantaginis]|uniref:Uncharacterized protein n=1 Tax=Arctia plantaginis TaxID=874455 RepID=A0A8S1AEN5_ARCPL|nr:unnamed protein product [Arctia plantaginis]CAB3249022.1 unnamed protein product [Arctia plantaginis]
MSAHRCGRRPCSAVAAAAGEPNVNIRRPELNRRISFYGSDFSTTPEPVDQSPLNKYWQLVAKLTNTGYEFWKKVYDDPYRWQLFKSIMLFIMGIKFSGDLFKYMNPSKSVKCGARHATCVKIMNRNSH